MYICRAFSVNTKHPVLTRPISRTLRTPFLPPKSWSPERHPDVQRLPVDLEAGRLVEEADHIEILVAVSVPEQERDRVGVRGSQQALQFATAWGYPGTKTRGRLGAMRAAYVGG